MESFRASRRPRRRGRSLRLLGAVLALVAATAAIPASARATVYDVNMPLSSTPTWLVALATADISESGLRFQVFRQNITSSDQTLSCSSPDTGVVLTAQEVQTYTAGRTWCTENRPGGGVTTLPPGAALRDWAQFDGSFDAGWLLSLDFYGLQSGQFALSGLNTPEYDLNASGIERQAWDLARSDQCVRDIVSRTGEFGYPYGTLFALSTFACAETVSAGVQQGIELYRCLRQYAWMACAGVAPQVAPAPR